MNTKCWDNIQPIKPQLFSEASLASALMCLCSVFALVSGGAEDLSSLCRSWKEPLVFLAPTGADPASCPLPTTCKRSWKCSAPCRLMVTLSLNFIMLKVTLHVIDNQGCVRTKTLIPNPLALLLVFLMLDQISLLKVLPSNKLATGLDHPLPEPLFSVDLRWMQKTTPASSW